MPTENRSRNTEMVSVPREQLRQFIEYSASVCKSPAWVKDKASLLAALAQPAEQHQGDPVAWQDPQHPERMCTAEHKEYALSKGGAPAKALIPLTTPLYTRPAPAAQPVEQHQGEPVVLPMRRSWSGIAGWKDQAEIKAWNACLDELVELGPLYTHPAPAVQKGEPVANRKLHIEVRECEGCNHIGIDDAHSALAACHECDWSGPEPVEDKCPACDRENVIAAACPDCGSRYVLATSKTIEVPADAGEVERLRAELVEWKERCQRNNDQAMEWMGKHDAVRAQLAERDALPAAVAKFREAFVIAVSTKSPFAKLALAEIDAALSASAEPSAMAARIKSAACAVCASHPCACAELGAPEVFVCQVDETCGEGSLKVAHLGTNEHREPLSNEEFDSARNEVQRRFQEAFAAPVERDERAEFDLAFPDLTRNEDDSLLYVEDRNKWYGWKARAALERKP